MKNRNQHKLATTLAFAFACLFLTPVALCYSTTVSTTTVSTEPLEKSIYERSVNIEVQPLSFAMGQLKTALTVDASRHNAVGVMGGLTQSEWNRDRLQGTNIGLVGIHYVSGGAVSQPFFRGEVETGSYSMRLGKDKVETKEGTPSESADLRASYMGTRGLFGYNWLLNNGINYSLAGGFGYMNGDVRGDSDKKIKVGRYSGTLPRGRFSVIYPEFEVAIGYRI